METNINFDIDRWLEGNKKLNHKTQAIITAIMNKTKQLETEGLLDMHLWIGIAVLVEVETKSLLDISRLTSKLYGRMRWFFPKEGITMERVDEKRVRVILKNKTKFDITRTLREI